MFCPVCAPAERGNVARFRARLGVAVGVLLAWSVCVLGLPGVASARWSVQATPKLKPGASFTGVSCISTTFCIAVGNQAFAERWNGRTWSLQRTPAPAAGWSLNAVSCRSPTFCIAVGGSDKKVLVERWNGVRWSVQSAPDPTGSTASGLAGVSCPSKAACFAVGGYGAIGGGVSGAYPLLERWNGTRWSIEPSAEPFGAANGVVFTAISCTSASACMAVGSDGSFNGDAVVAERWNGAQWSVQNPRLGYFGSNAEFEGVSCVSSRACAAVGLAFASCEVWSLAEVWDGERWGDLSAPQGDPYTCDVGLYGVSCPSATACLAVGTLVQFWDGKRWSRVHSPFTFDPVGNPDDQLQSVSCTSTASCEVVGSHRNDAGVTRPLAVRWTS